RIPHASTMSREILAFADYGLTRSFPSAIGLLWPAQLDWQPLWCPWEDPGQGRILVPLLGDPEAILAQISTITERLYEALVLDPAPVAPLLARRINEEGEQFRWSAQECAALAQDSRALSQHADWLAIYRETDVVVTQARLLLAIHAGARHTASKLLPFLSPQWAEAVLAPRDLSAEEIARFPRTIEATRAKRFLTACREVGAVRRLLILDRIAECLAEHATDVELAADPLQDQANCGAHQLGDHQVLRWNWQVAAAGQTGAMEAGLGGSLLTWDWSLGLRDLAVAPWGLPLESARLLEPREAFRTLEDWTFIEALGDQGIMLRAGSKGLLRSQQTVAYAHPRLHLDRLASAGALERLTRWDPVAYVLG
ncbi:MAG: hypothetical protein ABI743_13230, partial [bacterium]